MGVWASLRTRGIGFPKEGLGGGKWGGGQAIKEVGKKRGSKVGLHKGVMPRETIGLFI